MFKHILVPLDRSARAEQVLAVAAHLAKAEEISLPLLEARLSAEEGERLVEAMEQMVAEARR